MFAQRGCCSSRSAVGEAKPLVVQSTFAQRSCCRTDAKHRNQHKVLYPAKLPNRYEVSQPARNAPTQRSCQLLQIRDAYSQGVFPVRDGEPEGGLDFGFVKD